MQKRINTIEDIEEISSICAAITESHLLELIMRASNGLKIIHAGLLANHGDVSADKLCDALAPFLGDLYEAESRFANSPVFAEEGAPPSKNELEDRFEKNQAWISSLNEEDVVNTSLYNTWHRLKLKDNIAIVDSASDFDQCPPVTEHEVNLEVQGYREHLEKKEAEEFCSINLEFVE